jgi:hypothetical protein
MLHRRDSRERRELAMLHQMVPKMLFENDLSFPSRLRAAEWDVPLFIGSGDCPQAIRQRLYANF